MFLRSIGIQNPPDWLQDPTWIYPGLVLIGIWGIGAGIIVNLAGLRASRPSSTTRRGSTAPAAWAQLRHVTMPMMSPVIFYTLILGVVEVLQYFLVPLVLKNGTGEPGGTTLFFNLYLYKNFFTFQNMSYGATLAWLLFVITLVITLVLFLRVAALGLLRRASADGGDVDVDAAARRPALTGAVAGRAADGGRRPRARGGRDAVVPADADRGRRRGGVPVAARSARSRSRSRAPTRSPRPDSPL